MGIVAASKIIAILHIYSYRNVKYLQIYITNIFTFSIILDLLDTLSPNLKITTIQQCIKSRPTIIVVIILVTKNQIYK